MFEFLQVLVRPRGSARPQEGAIVDGLRDPNAHLLIVVVAVTTPKHKAQIEKEERAGITASTVDHPPKTRSVATHGQEYAGARKGMGRDNVEKSGNENCSEASNWS